MFVTAIVYVCVSRLFLVFEYKYWVGCSVCWVSVYMMYVIVYSWGPHFSKVCVHTRFEKLMIRRESYRCV